MLTETVHRAMGYIIPIILPTPPPLLFHSSYPAVSSSTISPSTPVPLCSKTSRKWSAGPVTNTSNVVLVHGNASIVCPALLAKGLLVLLYQRGVVGGLFAGIAAHDGFGVFDVVIGLRGVQRAVCLAQCVDSRLPGCRVLECL